MNILSVFFSLLLFSCSPSSPIQNSDSGTSPDLETDNAKSTEAKRPITTIAFIGDSLTAGHGLSSDEAYPVVLGVILEKSYPNRDFQILNRSASGSTSAYGVQALRQLLKKNRRPDLLVLALGANDGLRARPVSSLKKQLAATILLAQENKIDVILTGMKVPDNMGSAYQKSFEAVFLSLARELGVQRVPFLLQGVAMNPDLNQPDQIHPNADGQKVLAENVLPAIQEWLNAQL